MEPNFYGISKAILEEAILEEEGGEAHAKEMDKLGLTSTNPNYQSGKFSISPVGDVYAGFAKGPRDK